MLSTTAVVRDVCLLGGGHSHVLLIRNWAMNPLPGVRLTLVSGSAHTPYSGMLPGLIAGHYTVDDIHIDLRRLCAWGGVRFIEQFAIGLDLDLKQVQFSERPAVEFDVLSLDTGSTPDLSVPGAQEFVTPVKPVHDFYSRWLNVQQQVQTNQSKPLSIGVVGSGAGGFELVTAMRHILPTSKAQVYWFLRGNMPISDRPDRVGQLALNAARRSGVEVISEFDVSNVQSGRLISADDREYALEEILWCTGAIGPEWPAQAGMNVDRRGFVETNAYLQSCSHPFVFATGDIGTQIETPSPKAGVYAVRQAPVLFGNIRRYILGEELKVYRPQNSFLSLMATGSKRAIASRGPFAIEADWVWRWKDHIDQAFMIKFSQFPPVQMNPARDLLDNTLRNELEDESNQSQCMGCGGKIGGSILDRVIKRLSSVERPDVMAGLSPAADAAVIKMSENQALVQSVDQISAIVDDPYMLGRIAAFHALSDVVTLDAEPQSAQVMVSVARARDAIKERDLYLLMAGVVDALNEEQCALIGGHSTEGNDLSIGVVVNAILRPNQEKGNEVALLSNEGDLTKDHNGIRAGDSLVLTQPLGIATLFAGLMQQHACSVGIGEALEAMQTSNRSAASVLRRNGATAITDVTGFGLLGHLERLLRKAGLGARIQASDVPLFSDALALAQFGVRSSLWRQNSDVLRTMDVATSIENALLALLCDPQTGGGLLAAVPKDNSEAAVLALRDCGYENACVVGQINDAATITIR